MPLFYGLANAARKAGLVTWRVSCDRGGCESKSAGPHPTSNQHTTIQWLRAHGWVLGRRRKGFKATCPDCKAGIPPGSSRVKRTSYSVGGTPVTKEQFEELQSLEGYAHHKAFFRLRDRGKI
tara:strand:+ start:160 stop:525 length:366 start_codon:yes stop_codon:yes gene_type:complete